MLVAAKDMGRTESWEEWGRKVFERGFAWFLVWLTVALAAGPLLGEAAGPFVWGIVTPLIAACLLVHIAIIWRKRPGA